MIMVYIFRVDDLLPEREGNKRKREKYIILPEKIMLTIISHDELLL